ncbi:hypothetical protein LRS06_03725 [Hymenobacter sp. J193]|uniref:hypothetical protein n=1 Tax=Hymenobacter sp. J193 TaxID=2898429 RepID=UPI0021510472|nr:hypothetical protein [Hymenobacter sp. J193]MCR5886897.1 hypothetical protein [Hymenobacter sp. J193]
MSQLRYAWYCCPHRGALVQFALFFRRRCVAQWVLPHNGPGHRAGAPAKGVCLETSDDLSAATPLASGCCSLVNQASPITASVLRQALASGKLMVHLQDEVSGGSKTYSLIRMQASGKAWLLGPVTYQPRLTGTEHQTIPA